MEIAMSHNSLRKQLATKFFLYVEYKRVELYIMIDKFVASCCRKVTEGHKKRRFRCFLTFLRPNNSLRLPVAMAKMVLFERHVLALSKNV